MGIWLAIATLVSASTATEFAMTKAQWWAMCPSVVTDAQMQKRGLSFKSVMQTAPIYPNIENDPGATVALELRVATDGRVADARVLSVSTQAFEESRQRFGEAALKAVKGWRYSSPVVDGKPTCLDISTTIEYRPVP